MIYTSYYKNPILKEDNTISISLFPPKWFNVKEHILELCPRKEILLGIKSGKITRNEYISDFKEQLSKLDIDEMYNRVNDKVLLCYERPDEFCHRHLVREWFKENGYNGIELINSSRLNIAIIGSRHIEKERKEIKTLMTLFNRYYKYKLISGGARGVDKIAESIADELGIDKEIYLAEWDNYGKRAGFIRNETVIDNSDMVFAFWDTESVGTKHAVDLAIKKKIPLFIFDTNRQKFII